MHGNAGEVGADLGALAGMDVATAQFFLKTALPSAASPFP